ncbi:MAG TPA: C25 family cysteine peptidase, partial [Bacteroidales bacterium]|nr:C25 family cysteine peptidase [Bacteroidales bacterium]
IKSGRQWFAQSFEIILNKTYDFSLPALASGGEVKVRSVMAAKSLSRSSFGFSAGNETWSASLMPVSGFADSPVATGATVYSTLTGVALPLKIDVRYNKTSSGGIGYLDLIDINARCDLRFTVGQLDFRDSRSVGSGHIARFSIADAAGKAKIWDVTDPANVTLVPASAEGNALVFKKPSDSVRQFVAFDDAHLLKPHFVSKIPNQDLHASAGADMIILAPQVFMQQAQRLASFHSSASDLSVLVLDPVTIYNEFSSGNTDITAIRDFLRMLYLKTDQVTMPRYLLLFGDASYDYKNKIPITATLYRRGNRPNRTTRLVRWYPTITLACSTITKDNRTMMLSISV